MKRKIVIGMGSNTPDRLRRLEDAARWLASWLDNLVVSSFYPTQPEGSGVWHEYANGVAVGFTAMPVDEVVMKLKQYEIESGRTKEMKQLDIVPVDLDLVIEGEKVLRHDDMDKQYFIKGYREIN